MTDNTGLEDVPTPPHTERERRFLVRNPSILEGTTWNLLEQAYVWSSGGYTIRVRRELEPLADGRFRTVRASLTAKGPRYGDQRAEFETDVTVEYAGDVIERCDNIVRKKRHHYVDDQTWEIDVFLGANDGLILAELEGDGIRGVPVPAWAWKEITSDTRYNNEELAVYPVSAWDADKEWKFPFT